ncbi:MAG: PqqD family protein [Vicinamibacterales bacterium]
MDWNRAHRRIEGLELNELPDGYVIYQQSVDRVHYLNRTAVLVFELCDGTMPAVEIPGVLKAAYDLPEPPIAEVEQCLERFLGEGLIQPA